MSDPLATAAPLRYATFVVAGQLFGINVLDVQEVLQEQQLTPVPLAPYLVEGLINLRGQIVPAINMRRLLHLEPPAAQYAALSVVVRGDGGPVSLQVDEIGDVVELDAASFENAPQNVDAELRALLRGVHKLEKRLLLVLNTSRAVEIGK